MSLYAIKHVLNRCKSLLKSPNSSTAVKEEYHYWINWLNKELKILNKISDDNKLKKQIINIINKNPDLKHDIKYK